MTQQDFFNRYNYDPKQDFLGEGGFGHVFKAKDTLKNRYVAIKESRVSLKHKFSLKREVEIANEIEQHENIAPYQNCYRFTLGRTEMDYAVMKHYEYGDLNRLLHTQNLTQKDKHDIALGILKGVAHLHDESVIHRDIKPGNILIDFKNGKYIPKIADYGLSRLVSSGDHSVSNSSVGRTILFTAPEVFQGERIKKNIDIWAVGIILFKLYTGELPFNTTKTEETESGRSEIQKKIVFNELPETIHTVKEPYQTIIKQCLIKDNSKRPDNVATFLKELAGEQKTNKPQKSSQKEDEKTVILPTDEETEIIEKPKIKKEAGKIKISDFSEIIGLKYGDTEEDVYRVFGKPTEVNEHGDEYDFKSIYYYNFNNNIDIIIITIDKASKKVDSIGFGNLYGLKSMENLKYINSFDKKSTLLGKDRKYIRNTIIDNVDEEDKDGIKYKTSKIDVYFACYDHNNNRCSEISIYWWHH